MSILREYMPHAIIGSFIEIEGPPESAVSDVMDLINLSSFQIVRKNYGELMMEKFRELQLPLTNIYATFAKETAWKAVL